MRPRQVSVFGRLTTARVTAREARWVARQYTEPYRHLGGIEIRHYFFHVGSRTDASVITLRLLTAFPAGNKHAQAAARTKDQSIKATGGKKDTDEKPEDKVEKP